MTGNTGWSIWIVGRVDFDFGCSTFSLALLGLMGNWQNWLSQRARWWNIPNQSQPEVSLLVGCSAFLVQFYDSWTHWSNSWGKFISKVCCSLGVKPPNMQCLEAVHVCCILAAFLPCNNRVRLFRPHLTALRLFRLRPKLRQSYGNWP